MIPKRKYYLFCEMDRIDGKNQYWYNAEEKNLRMYFLENEGEKEKMQAKSWGYLLVIGLQIIFKACNISLVPWPFSTAIITGIATVLVIQFAGYPYQCKLFDPIEPVDVTEDELVTMARMGKEQLKKTPYFLLILVTGFFFFIALEPYIAQGDSLLGFLQDKSFFGFISEIIIGFLIPVLLLSPAPIYRTKLYRSIIRGE